MKLIHAKDYETMSEIGAQLLLDTIRRKPDAVICLATGSSPKRMYEKLCETINDERIDLSQITFVKLDEWYGVDPQNECTCSSFIKQQLLDRLYMPPKQLIEFVSNAQDVEQECKKVDDFLSEHPIDIMILGLGMNGHLGLNEPAEALTLPCHYSQLSEKTKTHDMAKGQNLQAGLTIGLQGIFEAKQVFMFICGKRKEAAYQAFMSQKITTAIPASLLWLHPNCVTVVDDTMPK